MAQEKDPYSLRSRLRDDAYQILSKEEYETLLAIKVGQAPGDPAEAKAKLFDATLQLINKQIGEVLGAAGGGIGIEGRSDLFNAMAATVWKDLSKMAAKADEYHEDLFTIIAKRVRHRLFSRLRAKGAKKRQARFDASEVLAELAGKSAGGLEKLLTEEFHAEFLSAMDELDETARDVMNASYWSIHTGKRLTAADIARKLGKPSTTVRSAYDRGVKQLRARLKDHDSQPAGPANDDNR